MDMHHAIRFSFKAAIELNPAEGSDAETGQVERMT